ncbi:MAG TPA: hypothetical protein VME45_11660 [Stellaceae bacterium]|nr:hypothetical protein [Stellaceae bacterium]
MTRLLARCWGALALVVAAFGFVAAAEAQGYSPTGTCPAHQWNYAYGSMTTAADCLQPSFGDLSGTLLVPPQGRLTLASHTPVLTTSTTGQSTIYYDAYKGNEVPVYNGANDVLLTIGSNEISDVLEASGAGEVLSGGVFDEWAISVSGTLTLCHATNGSGGGWAGDTGGTNNARGTGYSALDNHTRSYLTNKNAIADCYNGSTNEGSVAANEATYLGSFYTTANGQTGVNFGGSASGGLAGFFYLWNYYNRVLVAARVIDSGASYTYSSATVRQARTLYGNQVSFVLGVQEDSVSAVDNSDTVPSATNAETLFGFGLDTTTAFSSQPVLVESPVSGGINDARADTATFSPSAGVHALAALQKSDGANANTFDYYSSDELDVTVRY